MMSSVKLIVLGFIVESLVKHLRLIQEDNSA